MFWRFEKFSSEFFYNTEQEIKHGEMRPKVNDIYVDKSCCESTEQIEWKQRHEPIVVIEMTFVCNAVG